MIGYIYAWKAEDHRPFTVLQKFFTRMPYRHNSWGVGAIFNNPTQWQLEADLDVSITPVSIDSKRTFKINAPYDTLKTITIALAERYTGRTYGFLSLLNFVGRWVLESFGKDGRGFCPIRFGDVCSAIIYAGLQMTAAVMRWQDLSDELNKYHRNCYHSGDTVTICEKFPQYFTEVSL